MSWETQMWRYACAWSITWCCFETCWGIHVWIHRFDSWLLSPARSGTRSTKKDKISTACHEPRSNTHCALHCAQLCPQSCRNCKSNAGRRYWRAKSNIKWWNKVFVQSITSYYQMVLGSSEQERETVDGILRTFTPQSAFEIAWLADDEPLFEAMRPLARVSREALGRIPKCIDSRSPIWLFVSDSSPCMVTGKGRTLKKYPIDQVLSERRPGYVAAFKHDVLWGQDLRRIIIRSIELVAEARTGNPDAPIVFVAMSNGNELVGKRGINPQQHWPFEELEGHHPDILEDLKRHIRWFKMKCDEHKVEVAGLMAEPDCFFYNLLGPFQRMIKAIKEWFLEDFASDLNTRFRYVSQAELCPDLELRDQYHAEFNPKNQETLCSYFHNLFLILDGQRRMEQGIKAALGLPKKVAGLMDTIQDPLAGVTPMPDRWSQIEANLAKQTHADFTSHWKETAEVRKIKVDIAPQVITDEEMALRIPDTNIAEDRWNTWFSVRKMHLQKLNVPRWNSKLRKLSRSMRRPKRKLKWKLPKPKNSSNRRRRSGRRQPKPCVMLLQLWSQHARARRLLSLGHSRARNPKLQNHSSLQRWSSLCALRTMCQSTATSWARTSLEAKLRWSRSTARIIRWSFALGRISIVLTFGTQRAWTVCWHRSTRSWGGMASVAIFRSTKKCFWTLKRLPSLLKAKSQLLAAVSLFKISAQFASEIRKADSKWKQSRTLPLVIRATWNSGPSRFALSKGIQVTPFETDHLFHGAMKMYYMPSRIDTDTKALIGASSAAVTGVPSSQDNRICLEEHLEGGTYARWSTEQRKVGQGPCLLHRQSFGWHGVSSWCSCKTQHWSDGQPYISNRGWWRFFGIASDAILTPFAFGPKHILSVVDTDKSEVLWESKTAKAAVTGEPEAQAFSWLKASAKIAPAQPKLMASSSKQPPVPPPSKRMLAADESQGSKPPEPAYPPPKTRKVLLREADKGTKYDILTAECPLCFSIVVSGQKMCDVCGNTEELPLAGGEGAWKRGLAARRRAALVKMGMKNKISDDLFEELYGEEISEIKKSVVGESGRGSRGLESKNIDHCRKSFKRACKSGFGSNVDRFNRDTDFHQAKISEGFTRKGMAKFDLVAQSHIASAARTSTQVALGSAYGKKFGNSLIRLAFIGADLDDLEPPFDKDHWVKPWMFLWGETMFSEKEYITYVQNNPRFRFIVTWDGVEEIVPDNDGAMLEQIYERSYSKALENIEHKIKQSAFNVAENERKAESQDVTTPGEGTVGSASSTGYSVAQSTSRPRWNAYRRRDFAHTYDDSAQEQWSWYQGPCWSRRGSGRWYPYNG